jgi:hypothetical protein
METRVEVKTIEEFEGLMEKDDLKISNIIVNAILRNLDTKKRFTYVMTVYVEDEEDVYDITLEKTKFIETLMDHLPIQEKNEEFEQCSKILKAIDYLEAPLLGPHK